MEIINILRPRKTMTKSQIITIGILICSMMTPSFSLCFPSLPYCINCGLWSSTCNTCSSDGRPSTVSGKCVACTSGGCVYCANSNGCSICSNGYFLTGGQCELCNTDCDRCTSKNNCI